MKKTLLLLLSLSSMLLAHEIIEMQPYNPIKSFDTLLPQQIQKPKFTMEKGFSSPIKELNAIHTIIKSDDGFYLAGNSFTADTVTMQFNSKAFAENISGNGHFSSLPDEEIFSLSTKKVFVSLLHYSKEGKFLWRHDFANDMLSSVSMVRLKDGKLFLALVPLYIEKNKPFESYLFIYSKEGKLLAKKRYKEYVINSMMVVEDKKVLCGANKRIDNKFQETAILVDDEGFKIRDIDLDSRSYLSSVYDDLSKIMKVSTGYMLFGGQGIAFLDEDFTLAKRFFLGPQIDQYSEYYVEVAHEDKDGNIHLIGDYGHHADAITSMKLERIKRLNNPRTLEDQLDPAARKMRKNIYLSMAYDEMIREEEKFNRDRRHGYTGILIDQKSFLTKIKKDDGNQGVIFKGAHQTNGLLYLETYGHTAQTQQFLFDTDARATNRAERPERFCQINCMLEGNTLYYISLDEENARLKFNQIGIDIR